jgi:hypothetical protein
MKYAPLATALVTVVASLAVGTASSSANCEPSDRQHGGTAFLQRLAGTWNVSGDLAAQPMDGTIDSRFSENTLTLRLQPARGAQHDGIVSLSLRYDAQCDDYVAVKQERSNRVVRSLHGRGIARGDALDVTFPATSDSHRTDIVLEGNSDHATWTLGMAREIRDGQWDSLGELRLLRPLRASRT